MDLNLAPDKVSSFKIFQSRILTEYEKIRHEYGLVEIDATQSIGQQQQTVRRLIDQALVDYHPDETTPFQLDHKAAAEIDDLAPELGAIEKEETL
jgi:dTMP kinase